MENLELRDFTEADIHLINGWPPYRPEYAEMDRYVRKGGLPETFCRDPHTRAFVAVGQCDEIIGFSALIEKQHGSVEFVIFIRDDRIGMGIGEKISRLTLQKAFDVCGYEHVHLVVRQHKSKARRLYEKLGFRIVEERLLDREGRTIPFYSMVVGRDGWRSR